MEPNLPKAGRCGQRIEEITSTVSIAEGNSQIALHTKRHEAGKAASNFARAKMVTQSWHTQLANDRERQSSSAAGSADEERKQEFLESIAGPKGSESPDPQSETPIVVAGDEDDPAPPEQPLDERDTKIPRPIVSVNGKDVEKPEEKKPAA